MISKKRSPSFSAHIFTLIIITIMSDVRVIEFDKADFKTIADCLEWIKQSSYSGVVTQPGFALKSRRAGNFLSWEQRPVWTFVQTNDFWKEKKLEVIRYTRGVVLVLGKSAGDLFNEAHIPLPSEETLKKLDAAEKKKEESRLKKEAAAEELAKKRKQRQEEKEKRKISGAPVRTRTKKQKKSSASPSATVTVSLDEPTGSPIIPEDTQF